MLTSSWTLTTRSPSPSCHRNRAGKFKIIWINESNHFQYLVLLSKLYLIFKDFPLLIFVYSIWRALGCVISTMIWFHDPYYFELSCPLTGVSAWLHVVPTALPFVYLGILIRDLKKSRGMSGRDNNWKRFHSTPTRSFTWLKWCWKRQLPKNENFPPSFLTPEQGLAVIMRLCT